MAEAIQDSDPRSITEILRAHGYGHRPVRNAMDPGVHEIFSFNTMEVIGRARSHGALEAAGIA
jgi:hypothetical protein